VRAHSNRTDPDSLGNEEADKLANEGRAKAGDTPLKEFTQNESNVIFRITSTQVQVQEGKQNAAQESATYHIPGDVRKEAKREAMRQLLNEWMAKKKHGELVRVNPQDTLALCQIMRRQRRNGLLEFYLQALTQTADTHDRRQQCAREMKKTGAMPHKCTLRTIPSAYSVVRSLNLSVTCTHVPKRNVPSAHNSPS
jgi:hypothetical protein